MVIKKVLMIRNHGYIEKKSKIQFLVYNRGSQFFLISKQKNH